MGGRNTAAQASLPPSGAWGGQAGSSTGKTHRGIANRLENRENHGKFVFRPKCVRQSDFPHSRLAVVFLSGRGSARATRAPAHYRLGHAQTHPVAGCGASNVAASSSNYAPYRRPTAKKIGKPDTFWPKSDVLQFSAVFKVFCDFSMRFSLGLPAWCAQAGK